MIKIGAILFVTVALTACASGTASNMSGKERLKSSFMTKWDQEGEEFFKDEKKIAKADMPKAFSCMIDAIMFDMSDAQANRLADMLERKIPPEKDFVLYWVAPKDAKNAERKQQVMDRAHQICPDLADKLI